MFTNETIPTVNVTIIDGVLKLIVYDAHLRAFDSESADSSALGPVGPNGGAPAHLEAYAWRRQRTGQMAFAI